MRNILSTLALTTAIAAAPAAILALAPASAAAQSSTSQTSAAPAAPDPATALHRMGAYLSTLDAFEVTSESSIDLVTEDDRRIDLDGTTTYKVRRPDGFVIETRTDKKLRRFIYDGKRFTVHAPARGFYASVEAPPTIAEVLDIAADRYGIVLPLQDLFHWDDPANLPTGYNHADYIGVATVDGVETDQYAFGGDEIDWQIWIQRGDQPLPRKIVIVDRTDPAQPEFSAKLSWTVNPRFNASTFAFSPASGDAAIRMAEQ